MTLVSDKVKSCDDWRRARHLPATVSDFRVGTHGASSIARLLMAGGVQDEVELRMGCDWYGCFRGKWNDNNGGTGTNGQKGAVKQPFLCQGNPRQGGGH